jgi:MoxR-like ATPase
MVRAKERPCGGARPIIPAPEVLSASELLNLQDAGRHIKVDDSSADYLLAIVEKTSTHESLTLGVSPRDSQALYRAAQARALLEGRNYAIPENVKRLAIAVFGRRVLVNSRAVLSTAVAMSGIRL